MRSRSRSFSIATTLLMLAACASITVPGSGDGVSAGVANGIEPIAWRIQSNLNAGEPGYEAVRVEFVELAERMSGGRIRFQLHPVGALFPVEEGLEAIGNGLIDMALLTGGYYAGKLGPIANLEMGVPGSLHTPLERHNFFYRAGFLDLVREVYGKFGVYYLGPQLSPAWDMMSSKPITRMKDFEGLKIRAFGIEAEWYSKMGASPVFMDGGEIYTGLATGVVDAARWSSPSGNQTNSYHEVAKYYIQPSPMPVPNNFFAVNAEAWNKLPDDLKAILDQAAQASSMAYLSRAMLADSRAMQEMQAAGVEISRIDDAEWAEIEAVAKLLWEGYAEQGDLPRRGVELLQKYLADLGR